MAAAFGTSTIFQNGRDDFYLKCFPRLVMNLKEIFFFFEITFLVFIVTEMTQFDDLQNCNFMRGKW